MLRLLKLLKFGQVMEYFNAVDFKKRQISNYSVNRTIFVFYYFCCFNHFFACLWLFTARIDKNETNKGWLMLDKLTIYSHTTYDLYRESLFFCFSAMNG